MSTTQFPYRYAVKFVCNLAPSAASSIGIVSGVYNTDINIHNPSYAQQNALIWKKFVMATLESQSSTITNPQVIHAVPNPYVILAARLDPDAAMRLDCREITAVISKAVGSVGVITTMKGFVILYSSIKLDVVAEYSALVGTSGISFSTQYIQAGATIP
ncbi:MAG: hypothetical protein HY296_01745 [Thaumarchaeota archaeon]|nr:hypothetical protein [Nitrososphaerota archaeon]